MTRVHVVGAGVAGLACTLRLAKSGRSVALYEAARHAGGRCRSFFDPLLGCRVDNGNHLLLSGNRSVMAYLRDSGADGSLVGAPEAAFPFFEIESGRRWTVRPNGGLVPWWILSPSRRVPKSRAGDYLRAMRLAFAAPDASVADCLDNGRPLYRRFWEPLAVAILNTAAREAAARLLWPVITEIFGRGGAAARPLIPAEGLSETFVDPALAAIRGAGGTVHFSRRLRSLDIVGGRVASLDFGPESVPVSTADTVVLALPPANLAAVLPGVTVPREFRPIVNAHFRLEQPIAEAAGMPFLGIVGGTAHWLFMRGDLISVTVSAAESLVDRDKDEIAALLWADAARALGLAAQPRPPCRVVKERRATFAQTPSALRHRAGAKTHIANLLLAGDWTDTGLPATIEGAIRSGYMAAEVAAK